MSRQKDRLNQVTPEMTELWFVDFGNVGESGARMTRTYKTEEGAWRAVEKLKTGVVSKATLTWELDAGGTR